MGKTVEISNTGKAFSGDSIRVNRIGRDAGPPVSNPQLSVFLAVQPDLFCKFVGNATFLESGLVGRFLVVSVEAEPQHVSAEGGDIMDPIVVSSYGAWLHDIADTFRVGRSLSCPTVINAEQAARDIIIAFTNKCIDLQRSDLHDIGSCVARWGELAWRLALVLQVSHYGKNEQALMPLQPWFAESSVRLMKWFAAQQVQVLNIGRHQKKVKSSAKLVQVLSLAPDNWMTLRELNRRYGFKKPELVQLVNENVGLLVMETAPSGPDGGRPSPRIRMLG